MLRIVEEETANNSIMLRLDGRLAGEWIGVLRSSCKQAFQNHDRLILDLTGLSFTDPDGLELLQQLEQQQVIFINGSPFLREQLKQSASYRSVSR